VLDAGQGLGLVPIGYTSLNAMRLEKSYGIWSREFTWAYTPAMSGLDRFVDFDKPAFAGRDAALRERDTGSAQRLVTLEVHGGDADAGTFDPVWLGERRVGFVTSGGYGHHLRRSLALAYVDRELAEPGTHLEAHVVGVRTAVEVIPDSPYDPQAARPRG
jgi:dimethylglycine dehydrogenase